MSDKVIYVVASKVRQYASEREFRMGEDAVEKISEEVTRMLDRAMERCQENSRKTIKAQDI